MRQLTLLTLVLYNLAFLMAQETITEKWVRHHSVDSPQGIAFATGLALDHLGNIYVLGSETEQILSGFDYVTIKYDAAGVEKWTNTFNGKGDGNDIPGGISVDPSANVIITGESAVSFNDSDFGTVKYDALGKELWASYFNGNGDDKDAANAIVVDQAGNVIIAGESEFPLGATDFGTVKYNSEGSMDWSTHYDGNNFDEAKAVVVDDLGNVYVTGESKSLLGPTDFSTVKYDKDGTEQWAATFNGQDDLVDEAVAIAVDKNGNVYVTGESYSSASTSDFVLVKYNSEGTEQWAKRYSGTHNLEDEPRDLALDQNGNIFVGGTINCDNDTDGLTDYALVKYSPDGLELWAMTYDGTGKNADKLSAIFVDEFGNVYATGESIGAENNKDYATIKYNASGEEIWKIRYIGQDQSTDAAIDIVVAPMSLGGCVFVTGTSSIGDKASITTIKYDQAVTTTGVFDGYQESNFQKISPNPFTDATKISFELPILSNVQLQIYDAWGKHVRTLINGRQFSGSHQFIWYGDDEYDQLLPPGIYFSQLTVGQENFISKVVLIR